MCLLWSVIRIMEERKNDNWKTIIPGQIHDSIAGDVPDEEYIDFLKSVLDREEDVTLQINATKAIENTGEPGISRLIKLMKSKSEYRNYQIIIRHVLDGRIY